MSIDKVTVARWTCDACGKVHYANDDNQFESGFTFSVTEYTPDGERLPVAVTACKPAHIGKAAKAAMERQADKGQQGYMFANGGELPGPSTVVNDSDTSEPLVTPPLSPDWNNTP